MLDDGDLLGFSGRDLPALAQEADFPGFLDCPGVVDRQVQIEEFGERRRPPAVAGFRLALFNGLVGRQPGASGDVVLVMPIDLGCQQLVGLLPVADRFHGKKRGQSFLPEAELAFDFAFCLRILRDDVADAQAAEGALKLGERVGVAGLAGFVAEEAQAVRIKVVWQTMGEEDFPNMIEVGKGGFRLNETRADNETGGIVDGQGEDLEFLSGPPLVRGAVMLEEIAVTLALPAAAGLGAAFEGFEQQFGHVFENMVADVGGGALEGEAAVKFVGQEAEVGGGVGGESEAQKVLRLFWPRGGVISARWSQREPTPCGEPLGLEGV